MALRKVAWVEHRHCTTHQGRNFGVSLNLMSTLNEIKDLEEQGQASQCCLGAPMSGQFEAYNC